VSPARQFFAMALSYCSITVDPQPFNSDIFNR
jgi:hypothetical protein